MLLEERRRGWGHLASSTRPPGIVAGIGSVVHQRIVRLLLLELNGRRGEGLAKGLLVLLLLLDGRLLLLGLRGQRLLALLVLEVGLLVLAEMVAAGELLGADGAGVGPIVGVGPAVALQFVRSGEALAARQAEEGTFAGVPPQVGLQVGGLAVQSLTAGYVTDVLLAAALIGSDDRGQAAHLVGAVGARAAHRPTLQLRLEGDVVKVEARIALRAPRLIEALLVGEPGRRGGHSHSIAVVVGRVLGVRELASEKTSKKCGFS